MVKTYSSKDATWTNAAGEIVPQKFVPKTDIVKERSAAIIYKHAVAAEKALQQLHELMNDATQDIAALIKQEYALKTSKEKKPGKGSITWYNFDKSLKIEADVNEVSKWDDALMNEAKQLLTQFLNAQLTDTSELIKGLVNDAFNGARGGIDSRKVFQILKYEEKIKSAKFQKACQLIKQAQGIDKTKLYMRVWEKQDDGQYRNINLNFSSI